MEKIIHLNFTNIENKNKIKVNIIIELKESKNGPVFSATCDMYDEKTKKFIMGGQCFDLVAQTELKKNKTFQEIYDLWKKHHLNDMHPGTIAQEKALKNAIDKKIIKKFDYSTCINYLKSIKLYTDNQIKDINGNGYKYGSDWLYREIPKKDLERIYKLFK